MLGAVVLVLREVLEAALIISLLLALTHQLKLGSQWILYALLGGLGGSWALSEYAYDIAGAFDGLGQEIVNSVLYLAIVASIGLLNIFIMPLMLGCIRSSKNTKDKSSFLAESPAQQFSLVALEDRFYLYGIFVGVVSCAMAREGSEIWMYITSFTGQAELAYAVFLGGLIGAGIGISLGAIAYYFFILIPEKRLLPIFLIISCLISGGLSMQIVQELMQVGWLESQLPMWDSSWLISEHSLTGELFYALFGYESSPTPLQGVAYLAAIAPIVVALILQLVRTRVNSNA